MLPGMDKPKTIGLVAHDHLKQDMAEWVEYNYRTIALHQLVCTGTTGSVVEDALKRKMVEANAHLPIKITKLSSGPLGGDQQLGAMITEGKIDMMIFLWDPMQPQPHDVDVKALLRPAVLYNIPCANNRSTADFIISSPLFSKEYKPKIRDYSAYINRKI